MPDENSTITPPAPATATGFEPPEPPAPPVAPVLPPPAADAPKPGPNAKEKGADVDTDKGISVAKGDSTSSLGDQVHPDTQSSEADGHRTLVQPVTDPGPYVPEGQLNVKHPDRSKGEHRYADANEPFSVTMRTSTGHDLGYGRPDGDVTDKVDMAPDVAISGAASDCYHPTDGKETSLTDAAVQLAAKPKVAAPTHE